MAKTFNLSEQEIYFLKQLLTQFVANTKSEIHHTDTSSFKEALKTEEELANSLLTKLSA